MDDPTFVMLTIGAIALLFLIISVAFLIGYTLGKKAGKIEKEKETKDWFSKLIRDGEIILPPPKH